MNHESEARWSQTYSSVHNSGAAWAHFCLLPAWSLLVWRILEGVGQC